MNWSDIPGLLTTWQGVVVSLTAITVAVWRAVRGVQSFRGMWRAYIQGQAEKALSERLRKESETQAQQTIKALESSNEAKDTELSVLRTTLQQLANAYTSLAADVHIYIREGRGQ